MSGHAGLPRHKHGDAPIDTWRKMFEAAFELTGDTFFTLGHHGADALMERFDEQFYKSFDPDFHKPGFPEALSFTVFGSKHMYSSQRLEGYEFIIRGAAFSPSLFVYIRQPEEPLINREQIQEMTKDLIEIGKSLHEVTKRLKLLSELRGE